MISYELKRPTVEERMDAAKGYGFTCTQFALSTVYKDDMTLEYDADMARRIYATTSANGIDIVAFNGTFNMCHPDKHVREEGLACLERIASLCGILKCPVVSLCTGSRGDNMWAWHPDNDTKEAWTDLMWSMERAIAIANKYKVYLGVEIEQSNVIHSADMAVRLFKEANDPSLKIIMDASNLLTGGNLTPAEVRYIIQEAFEKVGEHTVLAHGKDLKRGEGIHFTSAGRGIVEFDYFLKLCKEYGYDGPMVLHGLKEEEEFAPAYAFIKEKIEKAGLL